MDYYLVPFAAKILESNPKLDDLYIPHLCKEIRRLNLLNSAGKSTTKTKESNENATCVNKGCKHHYTVNIKNGKAFGQCVVCSNFEYFHFNMT